MNHIARSCFFCRHILNDRSAPGSGSIPKREKEIITINKTIQSWKNLMITR